MTDKPITTYVAHRAKEPTTWAGLVSIAYSGWIAFEAGNLEGVGAAIGLLIAGLIPIFRKERK